MLRAKALRRPAEGRGEFVRLALEAAGAEYVDVARLPESKGGGESALGRRLGDAAADLLADPQLHENDQGIDWYAGWSGPVRPVTELAPAERDAVLAKAEATLAEIRRLGDMLA
eukprot:gene57046-76173_t